MLCFVQIEREKAMSAFWSNLHRLSQDQLFFGGYISPTLAVEINKRRVDRESSQKSHCDERVGHEVPWPRLASPH